VKLAKDGAVLKVLLDARTGRPMEFVTKKAEPDEDEDEDDED
jgi:hypothetical protein